MNDKRSSNPKLLFAAIIRVSTEQQAKQGESLHTQKDELIESVNILGGRIIAFYGGQEHGTPGYEKAEINRLLRDAQKKSCPWNAVIVCDASRWSRDNEHSRTGLDILIDNDKRFFIDRTEQDFSIPATLMMLGFHAVVGEFQAHENNRKSIKNKVHRAKRGFPTCGKMPPFRIFDEKTGWSLDEKKLAVQPIPLIAQRYLSGESMEKLAIEYGFSLNTLWDALTKYSGTIWPQHFYNKRFKIDETIETIITELLPAETRKAIKRKAQANKTFNHGHSESPFLLSGMIGCDHCGYSYSGSTNTKNRKYRYYKHIRPQRMVNCNCLHAKNYVPVVELEENVMRELFDMFGNAGAVRRAIEDATPDKDELAANRKRLTWLKKEIVKTKKGRQRVIKRLSENKITDDEADGILDASKQRLSTLTTESDRITENVANAPDADAIRKKAKLIVECRYLNHSYEEMTYENKRELCEMIFGGKRPDGHRMGIYIKWNGSGYTFSIHGILIDEIGLLPLSPKQRAMYYESGGGYRQKALLSTESGSWSAGASRRTLTPRGENNCCTHGLKGTSR